MSAAPAPQLPIGLVVNPASALGRGRRVAQRVRRALDALGVPSVVIAAASAAECQEAVRSAVAAGLRALILVGGDGLVGTVLQVDAARELPIGIVPAGSGNDFARQFRLSRDPDRAVARILAAEVRPREVDLGVVETPGGERWFAGGLSVGFDAAINRRANAIRLPLGPLRYQIALVTELLRLQPRHFTVSWPGAHRPFRGLLATTMNIRTLGGGIPIAPRAEVDDGRFDLVLVDECSRLRVFSVLGHLVRGRHERLPEVAIVRTAVVRIEAGDEVAYADGERVGTGPFEVRLEAGALRLLA
ncbi:diacylglycerol kinase [Leucobacter rhizosphaerae]|uniref:Diacylglycerol kinase n=1 Tax=Leucobacter rhizosphaerae TaxID=2932245 RepID=A0ABY4FUT3_9MICO|nr:diacylglycerol kinase family protein [Leucobacter rhizosphaerae]UOQ60001.1 diacylglycerol kinase [Leucobacter rhizosphaerae]